MALVLRWYFVHSNRSSRIGHIDDKENYQIHCGPAMGAFNRWTKGTDFEAWQQRHIDTIAERLMEAAATHNNEQMMRIFRPAEAFDK